MKKRILSSLAIAAMLATSGAASASGVGMPSAAEQSTKVVDPTGNCRWYVGHRDFRNPQDYKWPTLSEQNINPNLRD